MVYRWALPLNLMQWVLARRLQTIFADLNRGSHDAAVALQLPRSRRAGAVIVRRADPFLRAFRLKIVLPDNDVVRDAN